MKPIWINKVRKREVKSGYKILSLEIPTMKPLGGEAAARAEAAQPAEKAEAKPAEKIDFSNVKIEPLFEEMVDFETFSKSDFRAVKIEACEAVPKSKKLLKFVLNDGTARRRTILSGIHEYYEPEELVGKTAIAIVNLPPRKMMGIDSEGMLISAVHEENGREGLNLLMVDDRIPAGAKLYYSYDEPIERIVFFEAVAVYVRALAVLREFAPGGLLIPVDLPGADAFGASGPVSDKPVDVLGRVAEKQADFMREIRVFVQAGDQRPDAPLGVFHRVAALFQNARGERAGKVAPQMRRAVDVDQRAVRVEFQRQDPHAAAREPAVQAAGAREDFRPALHRAGEEAAGFQAGHGRRAVRDEKLLRHGTAPPSHGFPECSSARPSSWCGCARWEYPVPSLRRAQSAAFCGTWCL